MAIYEELRRKSLSSRGPSLGWEKMKKGRGGEGSGRRWVGSWRGIEAPRGEGERAGGGDPLRTNKLGGVGGEKGEEGRERGSGNGRRGKEEDRDGEGIPPLSFPSLPLSFPPSDVERKGRPGEIKLRGSLTSPPAPFPIHLLPSPPPSPPPFLLSPPFSSPPPSLLRGQRGCEMAKDD